METPGKGFNPGKPWKSPEKWDVVVLAFYSEKCVWLIPNYTAW